MFDNVDDVAVREQLREELAARAWAMARVSVTGLVDRPECEVVASLDAVAIRWSALLDDPSAMTRRRAAAALERLLWPTFRPADEWWGTPLGEVLAAARPGMPRVVAAAPSDVRRCEASVQRGRVRGEVAARELVVARPETSTA